MSACKSCGASIMWAKSLLTGRPSPFDAQPTPSGGFVIVKGASRFATDEDRRLHRDLFTSHFATCPQADQWRA